jgi:hypothetical protein
MCVWHVDSAGAEPDGPGCFDQAGNEHGAGSDVFGAVGGVFADKALDETSLVG